MRFSSRRARPVSPLALPILLIAFFATSLAQAQQIAITFDDLPDHGELPAGQTRLGIANSILATLNAEHLPPTYGFVNGEKVASDPATLAVLKAWRAAGNPLGSHTWSHTSLNEHTAQEFEADIAKSEPLMQSLMRRKTPPTPTTPTCR